MKDAVLTVRIPSATRELVEALARKEGRSLSQQVERLVDHALRCTREGPASAGTRPLTNALAGEGAPDLGAFRAARRGISRSVGRRSRRPG